MNVQTINEIRLQNIRMRQDKDFKCLEVKLDFHELDEEGEESPELGNALLSVYDERWADILEAADDHSGVRFNAFEMVSFERVSVTEEEWASYMNMDKGIGMENLFDEESLAEHPINQKFQAHYQTLKEQNKVAVHGRIALLENLTVLEPYRNKGYGSAFMHELLQFLGSVLHVDFVLLHAHPYQSDLPCQKQPREEFTDEEKMENERFVEEKCLQLRDFYERLGFVVTGIPKLNYMVLNLQERMYEDIEW